MIEFCKIMDFDEYQIHPSLNEQEFINNMIIYFGKEVEYFFMVHGIFGYKQSSLYKIAKQINSGEAKTRTIIQRIKYRIRKSPIRSILENNNFEEIIESKKYNDIQKEKVILEERELKKIEEKNKIKERIIFHNNQIKNLKKKLKLLEVD